MKKILLLLAFTTACNVHALQPVDAQTRGIYGTAAQRLAYQLPMGHLMHYPINDEMADKAVDILLDSLDFDHSYFLAADVEQFREGAHQLDDRFKDGDIELAINIYETMIERMSNRVDYVNTLLDEGFDLTKQESYDWDRKAVAWPATEEEQNELWRKKIKSQFVARKVAEKLEEERLKKDAELAAELSSTNETETVSVEINADDADEEEIVPPPTPAEAIRKQYQSILEMYGDNDADWLYPLYINAFARAYDPHTAYMSYRVTEDFDIAMRLSLSGIGAVLTTEDGAAKINKVMPGGPAAKDGRLQAGDRIEAVAQGNEEAVDIMHWPLSKSVRLIRGKKGTRVILTVRRGNSMHKIELVRDEVQLEESAASGEIEEVIDESGTALRIGVLTIPDFYADMKASARDRSARRVSTDVAAILEDFNTQGIDGLIMDLRYNGGGSLPESIDIAGFFINSGPVVQVKNGKRVQVLNDYRKGSLYDGPMVIMVNRQSASASEIVAAALQDYGRAVIVGDSRTHGKGSVQTVIPIRNGYPKLGTLKMTMSSFYRVAGGSTQLKGVVPDIIIPSLLDYMEIGEEFLPHALPWTSIDPTYYSVKTDTLPLIPQLRTKSKARRAADERFVKYNELLEKLGEKRLSKSLSLNLAERLKNARQEDQLAEYIRDFEPSDIATTEDPAQSDSDESKKGPDLMLEEAISIVSDLTTLQHPKKIIAQKEEAVVN